MHNTALWFAAQSPAEPAANRLEVMRLLLAAGAEINTRCEDGSTALHFAAWRGPIEVPRFLLSRGAKDWIEDKDGKLPQDYALRGSAPEKEKIARLFTEMHIEDSNFRAAIKAMEEGDLAGIRRLIKAHPGLVTKRISDDEWYMGNYFHCPTLLHFIAENPWRTKKLPANICQITQALIDAGTDVNAETLSAGNPHTLLDLVASSLPARTSGQQEALIDLLISNGAKSDRALEIALLNNEPAAAEYLLKRGSKVSVIAAAGLGQKKQLVELLGDSIPTEDLLEQALSVAFKYQHWNTAEVLLNRGMALDKEIVHAGTPLHHAALNNYREGCEKLIAMGARLDLRDRVYNGTPADWAFHGGGHKELSEWLRAQESVKE